MAGSRSVGTVSIPTVSGSATTSTSWHGHGHPGRTPHTHPATDCSDMTCHAQHVSLLEASKAGMAGSGSIGTVCIHTAFGSATGSTSTSWTSRSHPPYTPSHASLRHGIVYPVRSVVGSIWVRDGRVGEGGNGLHPHCFRVGNHVNVMGVQVAPTIHVQPRIART